VGRIGSVIGRYYAMDRDEHWERIEAAYRLLVDGVGQRAATPLAALSAAYAAGLTDEYVEPTVIDGAFEPLAPGDTAIVFNFRQDRARELLTSLTEPSFGAFKRPNHPALTVGTMIPYWYDDRHETIRALFAPEPVTETLGAAIAAAGGRQLRIAETEKYAHVTYFLNGGVETPFADEERVLVPSNLRGSAALHPALQTLEIGSQIRQALTTGRFDCVIANIAAPDMVGHTGDFAATVTACEVVDQLLGQLVTSCRATGTVLVVTADHGNAEQLLNPVTNEPDTHHTTNPVPFIVFDPRGRMRRISRPIQTLADVAPSVLTTMGIPIPPKMTGQSLVAIQVEGRRA
jgi:2,3-bisphosphoglycerate-independent phosphoglycerate mutase